MKSIKSRKQRKNLYNAPLHKRRKWVSSHLEENLLLKYDKRSLPVVKGDTVRVMRGSFRGHEDKVVKVDTKKGFVEIEGLIMAKADGNKIAKPIRPSNVIITKLNLTDKWRRGKLERGVSEEVKKEIEKEAEDQIKEQEEEKRRLEEEKKKMEKVAEEQEKEEETGEEELEETKKEKDTEKTAEPKEETEDKKDTKDKKPDEAKEQKSKPERKKQKTPAKKPTKKEPTKDTKSKKEEKPKEKTTKSKGGKK